MLLYRGIAFSPSIVNRQIEKIRKVGLLAGEGSWQLTTPDLKSELEKLRSKTELTRSDVLTGNAVARLCASSHRQDASFYGCRHNQTAQDTEPVLIAFEARQEDVIIDGRDFLYPIFQFGEPAKARPVVSVAFGEAIFDYLDRAWLSGDADERIALCSLAVQDDYVISSHATNTLVLGGRFNTAFASAFMVRAPVLAQNIISIETLDAYDYELSKIDVDLRDIISISTNRGP